MNDVVFYEHPTSPKHRNANGIYLYFGKFGGGKYGPLRLVMQYHADSWLFVKRAWAKADGDTLDLPQEAKALGWERDNSGGSIWEWSDAPITKPEHAYAVKKMCSAKSTTVRFEGKQYYDDKKLAPAQTKAMCEVIAIYEKATGRLLP